MLRIKDINHVIYRHVDLNRIERFLMDFGLLIVHRTKQRIYFRGAGKLPYIYIAEQAEKPAFGSMAFAVESIEDLRLAELLPGASKIHTLDHPGGGICVALQDPAGRRIELVYGIQDVEPLPLRPTQEFNTAHDKRRFGEAQRFKEISPHVIRLGHMAIAATEVPTMINWYCNVLGMLPSDIIVENEGRSPPTGAFLRLNRGENWTDHHTIALFKASRDGIHHASFEIQDIDAQQISHSRMKAQGWTSFWGVGRHMLGSQIFDYWQDPSGHLIEHFTDGDLCNYSSPINYALAKDSPLYQWGPPMTVGTFLEEPVAK